MEDQPEKKSYRLAWIAAASLAVFVVVLGGAIYLVMQTSPKQQAVTTSKPSSTTNSAVATKEEVKQHIDDATETLKRSAADQAALKAAVGDNKNQIKVGN